MSCQLHTMPRPSCYSTIESCGLLSPPRDFEHAIERITLWWSIYVLDRRVGIMLGVLGHIPVNLLDVRVILRTGFESPSMTPS